jgi:hypothetical protein
MTLRTIFDRSGKPGAEGEDLQRRARPEGERPKNKRHNQLITTTTAMAI